MYKFANLAKAALSGFQKTRMSRRLFVTGCAFLFCAMMASPADAEPLYGGNGSFHKIDPTDGSSVVIDSGNADYRLGLAFNPSTGVMYSVSAFTGRLSTINLTTGATTLVGSNAFQMTGLTFSGDLSTLYSFDGNGGALLAVNPADGSAVVIGPTGGSVLDLTTDSAGNVFAGGTGGIYSINTTTGAASLIGDGTFWTAIAFDSTDTLYGIEVSSDSLYTIDTTTGSRTLVGGSIGGDVRGLAFASVVPEPSSIVLFGFGAVGLGLLTIRRKRKLAV